MNYKNITALIFTLCAWHITTQAMDQQAIHTREPLTPATANLFRAIKDRTPFLVEHRLQKNPDVNATNDEGCTPLHCAIQLQLTTIVKTLITHPGIDLNKKDRWQETPLYAALKEECDHDMIEALVTAGADINIASTDHQETPLEIAIDRLDAAQVKLFLTKGNVSFDTACNAQQQLESNLLTNHWYHFKQEDYDRIKEMIDYFLNPGFK